MIKIKTVRGKNTDLELIHEVWVKEKRKIFMFIHLHKKYITQLDTY